MDSLDSPLPVDLDFADQDMDDADNDEEATRSPVSEGDDDYDQSNVADEGTSSSFVIYECPTTSTLFLKSDPVEYPLNELQFGANRVGREFKRPPTSGLLLCRPSDFNSATDTEVSEVVSC